jgi:hypothetical protein
LFTVHNSFSHQYILLSQSTVLTKAEYHQLSGYFAVSLVPISGFWIPVASSNVPHFGIVFSANSELEQYYN